MDLKNNVIARIYGYDIREKINDRGELDIYVNNIKATKIVNEHNILFIAPDGHTLGYVRKVDWFDEMNKVK